MGGRRALGRGPPPLADRVEPAMITETESPPSVAQMLGDIGNDMQTLVKQQLTLFQVELKNDVRRAVAPTGSMVGGVVTALVGGIVFAIGIAFLLPVIWPS